MGSLYTLATEVFSFECLDQATSKLDEILPTPILLDVLLKRAGPRMKNGVMAVNDVMSRLSTFSKLVALKGKSRNLMRNRLRRLCKLVCNAGIEKEKLFPQRLALAFQYEAKQAKSKIIEDGVPMGKFLHESGFAASATVLKVCLEYCEKSDPVATEPCVADHQRYKILVALLQTQVRYSMGEEAQSTREQALDFIQKWKLSEGIHLAELYSALASLYTLEENFEKSNELITTALEIMTAFPECYKPEDEETIDILAQSAISSINMGSPDKAESLVDLLALTKSKFGLSPKYADILAISYRYYMANGNLKQAGDAAEKCFYLRKVAFGESNVLTELAIKNYMEANFYLGWLLALMVLRNMIG